MHSYQATAPSRPLRRLLGEQLVGANLLSAEELEQALQIQSQNGSRIGEVLLDLGLVSEEALLPFVADQFDVPPARLREGLIDPACIKLLSPEYQKAIEARGDSADVEVFIVEGYDGPQPND